MGVYSCMNIYILTLQSSCSYLVFQINRRIEVGDFGVYRLAEHFVFDIVHKFAHFYTDGERGLK